MSAIYFQSESGEARLRGSERAHMGVLVTDLTVAAFRPRGVMSDEPLIRVIPLSAADYAGLGGALTFRRDFASFVAGHFGHNAFTLGDRSADVFSVALNTVLAMGSDPLCLLARLHGQCEIHAWIDGPNRAWMADLIDQGRASGIMRRQQGWEAVAAFLRESATEPVVTSYSVTDGFPNASVAGVEGEDERDAWYDKPREEKWAACMAVLRAASETGIGPHVGLEIDPDNFRFPDYFIGDEPDTAFSILEYAYALPKQEVPA